ncbi:MAG TPA: enoyl-CoA hydratase-related protein [Acidimicrobiales bacterium]|nr:enoyl-CoA hydratase-related protein [Acidimicrobiales bacterium]
MTEYETLVVERRGAVEWITFNRPTRLNAMDGTFGRELAGRVEALRTDTSVRVVVLRGAGRAFCAGLDIGARMEGNDDGLAERLAEIVVGLRRLPQPVIALVHGAACGGGFALALAADIRIAGESARMNDAFVTLGVSGCELGMSYFLPRELGMSVAAELMFTGRFIDASRALRLGLVSDVVPDADLEMTAQPLIDDMLRVAPLALRKTKETLYRAVEVDKLEAVVEMELATQVKCMQGPDFEEGLRAFVEKRAPVFGA